MVEEKIPKFLWDMIAGRNPFDTIQSIVCISIYTIIGSQLVGNVAVILMAEDEVNDLDDNTQLLAWVLLSWVSTVAGNLTLAGSAANIIVAEKASRHPTARTSVRFTKHIRVNGVLAMSCIICGACILYIEVEFFGWGKL
jgi:Na+/H+ antiporter NhaD/arsenite permease-like protein